MPNKKILKKKKNYYLQETLTDFSFTLHQAIHLVNCRAALTNISSSVSLIGLSLLFTKTVFICCCDLVEDGKFFSLFPVLD